MSFDALAPHYRWMEFVLAGRKLHRCRTAFLDEIHAPQSILLLGEGHGRSLVECRRRFKNARITCLDASAAMLAQARHGMAKSGLGDERIMYVHTDVLAWTPPAGETYDLIITNFFLDCFRADQLSQITQLVGRAAAPEANWLLSDFQVAPGRLGKIRSTLILWFMYAFFRVVTRLPASTITPPDSFLKSAGFCLRDRVQSEWGLLHSDWWQRR